MKGFSVKSVCECVLATALTAIFFVISGSSAAFAVFTALFGGVPLVFLAVRYGAAKSGICYAAAVIFVFIVSGCLGRAALNAFILMLPSFAVGYAMRNNFRYYQTMLAAAAAVLFGILLNVIIANAASEYDNAVLHIIDEAAGYAENTMLSYVASLGLEPGECLVVEDAPAGLEAAKAAGMDCAVIGQGPWPEKPEFELKSAAEVAQIA